MTVFTTFWDFDLHLIIKKLISSGFYPRISYLKSRNRGFLDEALISPVRLIGLNAAASNTCEGSFRPLFSTGIQIKLRANLSKSAEHIRRWKMATKESK